MKTVFGVEVKPLFFEIPDFRNFFDNEFFSYTTVGRLYLFEDENTSKQAEAFLDESLLLEGTHMFIEIENGNPRSAFEDYGIKANGKDYLLKEMISAFCLTNDDEKLLKMAEYQVEEHLIYSIKKDQQQIFFTDIHLINLIKGISKAYNCKTTFLDLDK